ncbi:hypothetical protein M8J76_006597 [Diaphorina citri]|nr:hypothetical protein M8J75_003584 [Diaphorina citri]KAI5719195.1 hypothetical protein M8J76_006597 [Diaphorina citri]
MAVFFSIPEFCIHCKSYIPGDLDSLVTHCRTCAYMVRPDPFRHKFVCYDCGKNFYQICDVKRHIQRHFKRVGPRPSLSKKK